MSDVTQGGMPKGFHEEMLSLGRKVLGAGGLQILILVVACVWSALWASHAWAADTDSRIDAGVAPVASELALLKAETRASIDRLQRGQDEQASRTSSVERSTLETSLNVRLLVEAAKLRPITLDGSAPVKP